MIRNTLSLLLAALFVSFFSGCATYNYTRPYPADSAEQVQVRKEHPSTWSDLPSGAYYDESRRLVFNGHQKGSGAAMLFGVVGVLVAHSANANAGEDRFGGEAGDFDAILATEEALSRHLGEQPLLKLVSEEGSTTSGGAMLKIRPIGLADFAKDAQGKIYVVLQAQLVDAQGKELWKGRYFASAKGRRTYEGEEGWNASNRLPEALHQATDRAVWGLLQDVQGALTGTRTVKMRGALAWTNAHSFECKALIVHEDEDFYVARMIIGDILLFAGTHVVYKEDVEIKDATFEVPTI